MSQPTPVPDTLADLDRHRRRHPGPSHHVRLIAAGLGHNPGHGKAPGL